LFTISWFARITACLVVPVAAAGQQLANYCVFIAAFGLSRKPGYAEYLSRVFIGD